MSYNGYQARRAACAEDFFGYWNENSCYCNQCGGGTDPYTGDPLPDCPPPPPPSPIIIDVRGDGFSLTDPAHGVFFDMTGNGIPQLVSWTSFGSDDVFLVLDRNGNGKIDNAKELFGTVTPQPASQDRNGFLALGEYDKPEKGGNDDGVIDSRDQVFNLLRLWRDLNHNGISEQEELFELPTLGVHSISLAYRESKRKDEFGNEFRYRAKINEELDTQTGPWAFDVILSTGSRRPHSTLSARGATKSPTLIARPAGGAVLRVP